MVRNLNGVASEVSTLGVRKMRVRPLLDFQEAGRIDVICERFAEARARVDGHLCWSIPPYHGDGFRMLLTETILGKIRKSYAKPDRKFWLLVYSTDLLVAGDDDSVSIATAVLGTVPYPF